MWHCYVQGHQRMFEDFLKVAQDLPLLGVKCRLTSSIRTDAGCLLCMGRRHTLGLLREGAQRPCPLAARNRAGASHTPIDGSVW
jgi:hypothetical protein